jgi:Flp pilus assembly protein, secretin CpaC
MNIATAIKFAPKPRYLLAAGFTALMLALGGAAPAMAQAQAHLTVAANAYGAVRKLEVEMNKSMIVDLPAGVAEVVVSQPNIAAAIMRTRTRAIIQGLEEGATNIIFIDDAGRTISVLDVDIILPPLQVGRALEATLARVIPGSNIKVETLTNNSLNDKIHFVLTGTVLSAEDKANAEAMANAIADTEGEGSLIQVVGPQQVMLQVTVSEIRRDVANQLGINLSGTATIGNLSASFNGPTARAGHGLDLGWNGNGFEVNAAIRALQDRGALRVLAQPVLTATSGQSAEFMAGGEFPITTSNINGQTVTYKPYGVELSFSPVVRSNGTISLAVDTSVSEIQAGSQALTRRDVKTAVELPPGTTLAIGGLLQERQTRSVSQLPGLGDIPILGALFRSSEYLSQQTELVILVTPYLVSPSPVNSIPVPTDNVAITNDAEAFFLGAIEKQYGVGATGEFRGGFSGSVGFVLD